MKRTLSLLLAASLLAGPSGWAQKLNSGEKKTLELSPGVVLVLVTYSVTATLDFGKTPSKKEFSYTEFGSGFVYRPDGYIVTNGHVVQHANLKDPQAQESLQRMIINEVLKPLVSKLFPAVEQELKRPLTEAEQRELLQKIHITHSTPDLKVYLANRKGYAADIKAYSGPIGEGKDVAILKIDATNLPTVKLGNSDNIHIQEPIIVIGYPGVASPIDLNALSNESLFIPTVTNGHVSAVKSDYKGTPVIQSDAAITHGNSGGPAFNEAGEVIGIATFGSAKEVAGFNFFVPINTGLEFVQPGRHPARNPGLFNQTLGAGARSLRRRQMRHGQGQIHGRAAHHAQRARCAAADGRRAGLRANAKPGFEGNGNLQPVVYGVGGVILLGLLFLVMRKKPRRCRRCCRGSGGDAGLRPWAPFLRAGVGMPAARSAAGGPDTRFRQRAGDLRTAFRPPLPDHQAGPADRPGCRQMPGRAQ